MSSSTWVWLKLIAPKIINCEEIFCFAPTRYENFVLFINDFSFESVIKSPPPKLSSLPLIITSPSSSPIFQGELDIIKALFPGGSITGAPKIRSMQIINEVEPNRRSIYCGSIGYISSNQRVDLNIAIRTVIASNNKLHFWGGGGIVYDSDVKSEYKETLDKIKPILDLLGINNWFNFFWNFIQQINI